MQDRADVNGGRSEAGDSKDTDRYSAIETGGGETVIYDREEPTAWLQSDYTVPVVSATNG